MLAITIKNLRTKASHYTLEHGWSSLVKSIGQQSLATMKNMQQTASFSFFSRFSLSNTILMSRSIASKSAFSASKPKKQPKAPKPLIWGTLLVIGAFSFTCLATTLKDEKGVSSLVTEKIEKEYAHYLPENFKTSAWWQQFKEKGYLKETGDDKTWRPIIVGMQAAVEAALLDLQKEGKLIILAHATHTDLPATPLCEGDVGDMHPDIANDPARHQTVYSRTTIMANYLKAKIPTWAIYSPDGLKRRTPKAQERYLGNVSTYQNLHDYPLTTKVEPQESGATVVAKPTKLLRWDGAPLLFSVGAAQATTTSNINWSLYLGTTTAEHMASIRQQREAFFHRHNISIPGLTTNSAEAPSVWKEELDLDPENASLISDLARKKKPRS